MQRFLFAFVATASAATAATATNSLRGTASSSSISLWTDFTNFQQRFQKQYNSLEELQQRFAIFQQNWLDIQAHNNRNNTLVTLGINQFSDLTLAEFSKLYTSPISFNTSSNMAVGSYGCSMYSVSNATNLPAFVDWRSKGAVTSVKDQGQCGSCWTFSATGAVEGAWAIANKQLINLSEQELVDCATGFAYGSHGCNGGQMEGAFKFIIANGQCADSAYPYTASDGASCQKQQCKSVVQLKQCFDVKPGDQLSLQVAVAMQPVAVAISADTKLFQSYSSGVITSASCYTSLNHGVLIVGYGTEQGQDYWLIKNSWGSSWGDNGYVKIARSNSSSDNGICGVAMDASFPTL